MVDYYDNVILPKIVSVNIILLLKRIQHILQVRIQGDGNQNATRLKCTLC
jgi:hypothetical protein